MKNNSFRYSNNSVTHPNNSVTYPPNDNIPNVLLTYISCSNRKTKWSTNKSIYPLNELRCSNETNWKDSKEIGPMLDFFIKVYDKPLAKKYIFAHDHDTSYHYHIDFWKRIKTMNNTEYFLKRDFGGLYCQFITFNRECRQRDFHLGYYELYKDVDKYMIDNKIMNKTIKYYVDNDGQFPCGSTFFVTQELIRRNPLSLYKNLRRGLQDYILNHIDDKDVNPRTALYGEMLWHMLFTEEIQVPMPDDCKINISCV